MRPRCVSTARALGLVHDAVVGVRLLAGQLIDWRLTDDRTPLPSVIESIATLVELHVRDLDRMVRGEVDPASRWHREVDAGPPDAGPDVVLTQWSVAETLKRAEAEVHRARRRAEFVRRKNTKPRRSR
jgi:hypothetical protein